MLTWEIKRVFAVLQKWKNKIQSIYIYQVSGNFLLFNCYIPRIYDIRQISDKNYQTIFSQKNINQISDKKYQTHSITFLTNKYHPNFRQRQYQTNFKHNKSTKFPTGKFQQKKSLKKKPRYCHGFTKCGGCLYGLAIFICLAKAWMRSSKRFRMACNKSHLVRNKIIFI